MTLYIKKQGKYNKILDYKKYEFKQEHIYFKNKNKYIELSWKKLLLYADESTKIYINEFRRWYINLLKNEISTSCPIKIIDNEQCELVGIGTTDDQVTAASDIDLNLDFKIDNKTSNKNIESFLTLLNTLYDKINNFHNRYFKKSLSELFDVNIYASKFYLDRFTRNQDLNSLKSNDKQRAFAFLRASILINKNHLISDLSEPLKIYFNKSISLLNEEVLVKKYINISEKNRDLYYRKSISRSIENVKNISDNIDQILTNFSMSKLLEHDTYYSVGGFLHILGDPKDIRTKLDNSLYIDSLLDNYGFLLDNLFDHTIEINKRILRVAKYLERICDAILNYLPLNKIILIKRFKKYKNLCGEINLLRKSQIIDQSKINKSIILLFKFLSTTKKVSDINSEKDWFKLINILLNPILKMI
jgi:hypothetical protein